MLGCLILSVVIMSSKKQMGWVTAWRIIALVKNKSIIWYFSHNQSPRQSVR